jgi:hypothetical protein
MNSHLSPSYPILAKWCFVTISNEKITRAELLAQAPGLLATIGSNAESNYNTYSTFPHPWLGLLLI